MNTPRWAWLFLALTALAACAGGGTVNRASDTDAAIANMNLGAGYLQQGNVELAIERLRRAIAQDPQLVLAHSTIAFAYDQIGSLEEAETHFRRATQLDPEDGAAANSYAAFLCNRGNRWAEAEPYFRRAAQDLDYTTPEVAMTNAGICARDAGELEKAEESFRAALSRNPRYPGALLNMIELSYQRADYLQTRAFVQRYLAVRPATAPVLWMCFNAERELDNVPAAERCATQLRTGFQGSSELAQLEAQQRDGR
jgi:type IV pilus assembly protein PilF